jgi:cell division protein FtsB
MNDHQGSIFGRLLRSKIFFAVIIILFIVSSLELLNEIGRRNKISYEIKKQRDQIEKLQQQNTDLSSLIQYLNTDNYVESEARKKLNLSKSGESLVVVENASTTAFNDDNKIPNSLRWWNYFFR